MPILVAPEQTPLKVARLSMDEKSKKRLASLGLVVDSDLSVISSGKEGIVLLLKGTRLALDRDIASRIFVRVL